MTTMPAQARARTLGRAATLFVLCAALALGGCGTSSPKPIAADALAEAQTFPYYRVYWAGPSFDGHRLVSADGLRAYVSTIGDSVYYGDCVERKGVFGVGSCELPLQVTTVVYVLHSNATLGTQRNMLVRGVPATVYDEGRSIEIYSGRVAIDIFSDSYAHAMQATRALRPMNAPGAATGNLPPPVFCPGLSGPVNARLARVMADLPGRVCQRTDAEEAYIKAVTGRSALPGS